MAFNKGSEVSRNLTSWREGAVRFHQDCVPWALLARIAWSPPADLAPQAFWETPAVQAALSIGRLELTGCPRPALAGEHPVY